MRSAQMNVSAGWVKHEIPYSPQDQFLPVRLQAAVDEETFACWKRETSDVLPPASPPPYRRCETSPLMIRFSTIQ